MERKDNMEGKDRKKSEWGIVIEIINNGPSRQPAIISGYNTIGGK